MLPFEETEETVSVFIKIPESLTIRELIAKYENAIEQSMASSGFGEVTGSCGLHRSATCHHEIPYCGIYIDLFDQHRGLELIRKELIRLNAPTGTVLEFSNDEMSFYGMEIHDAAIHELEYSSDPQVYDMI
ncbi:MAG TPA: hypothetical protein VGP83_03690 [Pyrinomonadaceae bacterium]|nr:hypothetical protein [Pyrinomonadaceae bacterium]